MRISNKIYYPYPVWGWKDDYSISLEDKDIVINEIEDKDFFKYELELKSHNEDIEKLIHDGKAIYLCVATCPATFKSYYFKSEEPKVIISIPRKEVNSMIDVKWMVVSTAEISNFESDFLNPDYGGKASFPLGAMIAYIVTFDVNVTISDECRSLDEIIVVVKNTDSDEIDYDFDSNKIKVKLPEEQLGIFTDFGAKFSMAIHSTIVFQAIFMAVSKVMSSDDSLEWVYILKQYIDVMPSDDIPTTDEVGQNGYSIEECLKITDYILQSPVKRMFVELKLMTDQN